MVAIGRSPTSYVAVAVRGLYVNYEHYYCYFNPNPRQKRALLLLLVRAQLLPWYLLSAQLLLLQMDRKLV